MLKNQKGVTIVEVLIVFSVIAIVLVVSMRLFRNYQNRESLHQGTVLLATKINDVLNDPQVGSFFTLSNVACAPNSHDANLVIELKNSTAQSSDDDDCVVVGKLIQLGLKGTVGETTPPEYGEQYRILTLVSLEGSQNAEIYQILQNPDTNIRLNPFPQLDYTNFTYDIPQGLSISQAYTHDQNGNQVYIDGLAILQNQIDDGRATYIRGFSIKSLYNDNPPATAGDKNRNRPNAAQLVEYIENHKEGGLKTYLWDLHDEIIICLLGRSEHKTLIRVGNASGTWVARPDLDITNPGGSPNPYC
ncbi:MAG: prepilin-type N-terminal cleavage/methylation domain-containing protein [Candidatus Saccharibacteria bacterium]|nr:prepilin-type N-terminal cleavage/methylation domain-containing protein [Candidatus Saccharibacteria bacterium]